jgi:hypothetical protein
MSEPPAPNPTFSPYRRWGLGLQVAVLIVVVFAVMVMVNYVSRGHPLRIHLSTLTSTPLSPRTLRFLSTMTNQVKVTVYFDKTDSMYSLVSELLKEYRLANPRITIQTIDSIRDAGLAIKLKEKYPFLASPNAHNCVIFDCDGRVVPLDANLLAQYALEQIPNDKEREFRRRPIRFEGERAFTATLIRVTTPTVLKAYFLQDDGEHPIDSNDERLGYSKFATILQQNSIQPEKLSLLGTNQVPRDCNLLVIAGPTTPIPEMVLGKVAQYLNEGGRLLAMFSFASVSRPTGLEPILAKWGVDVGTNIIRDFENTTQARDATDMIVGTFGNHQLVDPLKLLRLHLIMPRAIGQLKSRTQTAEAPKVEELARSGSKSVLTDNPQAGEHSFPVMVAVEKGTIKDVTTERGTTRMVIIGDSIFLANHQIESAANRDFAQLVVNWLLDRTQLLDAVGSRPIGEYRFSMTRSQLQRAQWILLGVMPGGALVAGFLVWFRRRR